MTARRLKAKQIGLRAKPEGNTAWNRLPFVGKDHSARANDWDLPLTGGYLGGIEAGEFVARMYLKYLRDERESPIRLGSSRLQEMLNSLAAKQPSSKAEEDALRGQRVGFISEIGYWLEAAAERLGSSLDAIPERSFICQVNTALSKTDEALMTDIAARGVK